MASRSAQQEGRRAGCEAACLRRTRRAQCSLHAAIGVRMAACQKPCVRNAWTRSFAAGAYKHAWGGRAQVRELQAHIAWSSSSAATALRYETATVTRVEPLGMGERVCVDLCASCAPGEGLLLGNFCRTLFLVEAEACALRLCIAQLRLWQRLSRS